MRRGRCFIVLLAGCGAPLTATSPPGQIIGRVEVSLDVPAGNCQVLLEGAPLGGRCNESGQFDIRGVPPGRWDLRVLGDPAAKLPGLRIAAAANPGFVTDAGTLRLARPGSIGGRVAPPGPDLPVAIVAVPEIGAVSAPNDNGGFLLDAVSPGVHEVLLLTDRGSLSRAGVKVLPARTTIGVDFDLAKAMPGAAPLSGRARRANAPDDGHEGLAVELVDALDGKVVAEVKTDRAGAFRFDAPQGAFVVRARDGASPVRATIPSVIVAGRAVALTSVLVVFSEKGDLDGDGVANDVDPDRDGDGEPDASDAFPWDPAETRDADGDGLGDRADLRVKGGKGVDNRPPTPDSDGDGKLDFEDNCPAKPNPDQKDGDGDGVGDACDNCPATPNEDQKDSAMNGTGDACRACKQNGDCAGGRLCVAGVCADCITSAQCGDRVCKAGACVACAANADCPMGRLCDPSVGRCVECVQSSDCGMGRSCAQGVCLNSCTKDAECPGQYCANGRCVACRNTGDCPQGLWCDAGLCRALCAVDGDCTGARSCDKTTRTCVPSCAAQKMCPQGSVCDANMVCRPTCDLSVKCPAGLKCNLKNVCEPECAVNADCGFKPHTLCTAGACVPDGSCGVDTDCTSAQMCVGGQCAARPTVLVPGKGYPCAQPCECRLGERCEGGFCVADLVPTKFVSTAGAAMGGGTTPNMPSSDLRGVVAAAKTGDVIALRSGDSFAINGTIAITADRAALVGGWTSCGPNRWVRDAARRSSIVNSKQGVLEIPGTIQNPAEGVMIANLTLRSTDGAYGGARVINATRAPRLTVQGVAVAQAAYLGVPSTNSTWVHGGVYCGGCSDVRIVDVSTPGFQSNVQYGFVLVDLDGGSGRIEKVHAGPVLSSRWVNVVRVASTTGPVTISGVTSEASAHSLDGGAGILVAGGGGGPVTVENSTLLWSTFGSQSPGDMDGTWFGIHLRDCPSVTVTGNVIDGRPVADAVRKSRYGIWFQNSAGSASMNAVHFPKLSRANQNDSLNLQGYVITGPQGGVRLDRNIASGGAGSVDGYLVNVSSVTTGVPTITGGTYSIDAGGSLYGLHIVDTRAAPPSVIVSDASFQVGAPALNAVGLYARNSAVRIDRSRFVALGPAGLDASGANVADGEIDLNQSFVYGGPGNRSYGLQLHGVQAALTGNTIDAGGRPGNPTIGIECTGSQVVARSNLVSGGKDANKLMLGGYPACYDPANYRNNYFWHQGAGGLRMDDKVNVVATPGQPGVPDARGNIYGGTTGCYDPANKEPDFHIAANSPCIDRGAAGPQKDGKDAAIDIEGAMRVKGKAADIGCSEKQ